MEHDLSKTAKMKILIAEDDPIIRGNLFRTLQLEGYQVFAAEDGQQALGLALAEKPDLILSDMMMPVMDGHEFLRAIRHDNVTAHTPFVFLTARADRTDIREGMKLGADDYLSKPFLRNELLEVVQTQLSRQALRLEEKNRLQQETVRLKKYDSVTDLANRQGFEESLDDALAWASARHKTLAVIFVTLNALHSLRQSHGARLYEQVLRAFAARMFSTKKYLPPACKVAEIARICDSSFAFILSPSSDTEAEQLTKSLLVELVEAVVVDNEAHYFQPTAGIALFPRDGQDAVSLIQNAEAAEPEPKPGGSVAFYCVETSARLCRRMKMLQALHTALANDELFLCFQPQIDANNHKVIGFEALLRWQHPELGLVSPVEFIPLAETSGLIIPIGAWVLTQACLQMQSWLEQGFGPMRIAVNLSARQFESMDLYPLVCRTLAETGLAPQHLELEITETIAMQNAEQVLRIMQQLTDDGVMLAMDDFGTGYSSLSYLKGYPLNVLKIDQVFVRHFLDDESDEAIIKAIIALSQSFKLAVIAEGVETQAQAERLKALGCQYFQGYLFSKPLTATQATLWLEQQQGLANETA